MSLRVNQITLTMETKTKDNVFVTIPISVQNRVRPEKVYDAYYKLSDPMQQIQAYVEQVILGHVPGMTLDEVFASQSGIAAAVKQELDADMAGFGYEIVNVLVTDIVPDAKVKSAMNDINAAQREQVAANARGEAEKILVVKKAEAEAQSKALQGQGIANQRKAIIEGLQGSIEQFQKTVAGASTSEVMQLVMVTQYFDTIKSIGEMDKTNTLFLSHSPGAVRDISEQILQAMLVAERAKLRRVCSVLIAGLDPAIHSSSVHRRTIDRLVADRIPRGACCMSAFPHSDYAADMPDRFELGQQRTIRAVPKIPCAGRQNGRAQERRTTNQPQQWLSGVCNNFFPRIFPRSPAVLSH